MNEKDLFKLHKTQNLIGLEIPRVDLPEELGTGPEYREPNARKGNAPSKGNFKKGTQKKQKPRNPRKNVQNKATQTSKDSPKPNAKKPASSSKENGQQSGKFRTRRNVTD